eukprot:TRINITY_DN6394_c0_g1_i1.p1 TRINITY_DN6394_c0_g1~~TRINITY_DN6394_c0_g1_i1.p1  ORF type:complete len:1896 (-),score=591.61 TRINITY_DN6394_c0_g1_i1:8-5695(-)
MFAQGVSLPDLYSDNNLLTILSDLRNNNDEGTKIQAAKGLQNYVSAKSRELSGENFKKFLTDLLKSHIWQLINSPVTVEKIGGLIAIDGLIDVAYDDVTPIIANYYRVGFKTNDAGAMTWAARCLGHLATINNNFTTEAVGFDFQTALEWLQGDRQEAKRHSACLILKEVAINSPTLFYSSISSFMELIWVALRDSKAAIRESAVEALGASLKIVSERESKYRLQWFQKIYEESQKAFQSKIVNSDWIHSALLTLAELLKKTGSFLRDRYDEIATTVLRYKGDKDKLVKKGVIILIPILAFFAPDKFTQSYLDESIHHLLFILKRDVERPAAFLAIGETALVVRDAMRPYLDETMAMIKVGLTIKTKGQFVCQEAAVCHSMLARAVGSQLQKQSSEILDRLFMGGLSQTLAEVLSVLSACIPNLSQEIEVRLLDLLSFVLDQKPFNYPGTPYKYRNKNVDPMLGTAPNMSKEEQDKLTAMALNMLGSFGFDGRILIELVKNCVINYLQDPNIVIRREAATCCSKIMASSGEDLFQGFYADLASQIIEKLITVGVADSDLLTRKIILSFLDHRFDTHLSQATNLRALFVALNDESIEIREVALKIICRLGKLNPAHVLPSLRKYMIQLLRDLEHSGDHLTKEESSNLLGILISESPGLAKPYVEALMRILLPKLSDPDAGVSSSVLSTVGALSTVSRDDMSPHIPSLFPLIIETLQDQSSHGKREVALKTLGQLTESTGYVIKPLTEYPKLLEIMLTGLQTETNFSIRMQFLKVFGILGALDPYAFKLNQLKLEGRLYDDEGTGRHPKADDNVEWLGMSPSSEDYYPTITITVLIRILRDPSLSQHRALVIHALMLIVKSLGSKVIQFLPQIMPPFLQIVRTCEPEFRILLFQQLGQLVARVKQHIRDYLPDIFNLIDDYWNTPNVINVITLIEGVAVALSDEFKPHIAPIIKKFLVVLSTDTTATKEPTMKVLHALEIFGTGMDDYLHLVIPAILKLCEFQENRKRVRILALKTISGICHRFSVSSYASRIIHPLARILDNPSSLNEIIQEVMRTLCVLVRQMGEEYVMFMPMISKGIARHHVTYPEYDQLVATILQEDSEMDDSEEPPINQPLGPIFKPTPVSSTTEDELDAASFTVRKLKLNETNLSRAWEVSQRTTKEDWVEWLKKFSFELLKESPSPALRSCISLANEYHPLVRELFNAGFVSCWAELPEAYQQDLIRALVTALKSPTIPPEILQVLLNLAEFMEQDEKPLPIDPRTLGELAEKCHAYAKALHYKEIEFRSDPTRIDIYEAFITINNRLQIPQAALGILTYGQRYHIKQKESWSEELGRWDIALMSYQKRVEEDPVAMDATLGKMRCLLALGEWEKLAQISEKNFSSAPTSALKSSIASLAAESAWNLGKWQSMDVYVKLMEPSPQKGFFSAILAIHQNQFQVAQNFINESRAMVDTNLTALIAESYKRAYKDVIRVQQLSELEEIIAFKREPERRGIIIQNWNQRLLGAERNIETWKSILSVHSLVLSPRDDMNNWLKFSSLCMKNNRFELAEKTIMNLMGRDGRVDDNNNNTLQLGNHPPRVTFAYLKLIWEIGNKKQAFDKLKGLVTSPAMKKEPVSLLSRMFLKLGKWTFNLANYDEKTIHHILNYFQLAIDYDKNGSKTWHAWAMAHYEAISHYEALNQTKRVQVHLVPALKGLSKSIALSSQTFQDTLRLITLWWKYGALQEVESALQDAFNIINIDAWLLVIPQLIARIHAPNQSVRKMIQDLLISIGRAHPQALVYPITVAAKSQSSTRVSAAMNVVEKLYKYNPALMEQAQLVSHELIRVSIIWHEMWYDGCVEASHLNFEEHNPEGMIATFKPLHEILEKGPETPTEQSFFTSYGKELLRSSLIRVLKIKR